MAEHDLTVVEGSMVAVIAEAEINQQVATAKKFPRSEGLFRNKARALILASEDSAAECIYALPRGGKTIEGPSVRMAEVLSHCWGNNRVGARIVDETENFIVAQGVFHDLEANVARYVEIQRRIRDSKGQRFGIDMIGVTANAASSIAMREATLKGIPRAIWGDIYAEARALIVGTFESIDRRRTKALEAFRLIEMPEEIVLKIISKRAVKDITPDDLMTLRGVLTAIKDGDTTPGMLMRQFDENGGPIGGGGQKADISGKLRGAPEPQPGKSPEKPADAPQPDREATPAQESAAPATEAPAQAEAAKEAEPTEAGLTWTPEEKETLGRLDTAAKEAVTLEALLAAKTSFGPAMIGQSRAFVLAANGIIEARQKELGKAGSKARKLL